MIAEKIPQARYNTNNFKYLSAYVLRVPQAFAKAADPLDWGIAREHQTEDVAWAKAVNSVSDHIGWAVKESDLVQRANKRAQACKSYHYVVSFPAGEKPSRETLENIEDVLSTVLGYAEHQRLMAVHTDTPNLHMHVVVNRVHPRTFKVYSPPRDYHLLSRAAAELEDIHGLVKTNHEIGSRIKDRDMFRPYGEPSIKAPDPPLPPSSSSPDLKAAFVVAKDEAAKRRRQALEALRASHNDAYHKLVTWHVQRRENARKIHLSRADRQLTMQTLRETAKADYANLKTSQAEERAATRQIYPFLTWDLFMRQQAQAQARAAGVTRSGGAERHQDQGRTPEAHHER